MSDVTTAIMLARHLYLAFLRVQEEAQGRTAKAGKPNPWPKCPVCFRRVPALCPGTADEPCGLCLLHGCCPTHPPKKTDTDN